MLPTTTLNVINLLQLFISAIAPVLLSVILFVAGKNKKIAGISYWVKQIIIGLLFGALAIVGTEFGVNIGTAVINVRDAAPLCAGLLFGAPSGIIAGVIGGVERWFSVLWGAGAYTRLACTLGTIIAGVIGAFFRIFMLRDRKPAWYMGLFVGFVAEVIHLLLVFITNLNDIHNAFNVIRECSVFLIVCNTISVMLAVVALNILSHNRSKKNRLNGINHIFQKGLLLCIIVAFTVTIIFSNILQTQFTLDDISRKIERYVRDIEEDINDASDQTMLLIARTIANAMESEYKITFDSLKLIAGLPEYDITEINIVNSEGVIVLSTNAKNLRYNISNGDQSREFLILINDVKDASGNKITEYVQSYQPTSIDPEVSMKYAAVSLKNGGFVQLGYDAKRIQKDVDKYIVGISRNRHFEEDGYMIIANKEGVIVSNPKGNENVTLAEEGIIINTEEIKERELFEKEMYYVDSYCMYDFTEGYYLITVLSKVKALFYRDMSAYMLFFMDIIVFAALFALVYFLIDGLIVGNIKKINGNLAQITAGNLDVTVDVHTNAEFSALSDDINATVATLKRYIEEAAARIDKELEFARAIQTSTLPKVIAKNPHSDDFVIEASMDAAREVGGDFYDFYMLDENRLVVLVADVSGKGISAAMFMMKAKTIIKSCVEREDDIAKAMSLANSALCENNDAEMFVTCWMGIYDFRTCKMVYVNAGHNPPLVKRYGGK